MGCGEWSEESKEMDPWMHTRPILRMFSLESSYLNNAVVLIWIFLGTYDDIYNREGPLMDQNDINVDE